MTSYTEYSEPLKIKTAFRMNISGSGLTLTVTGYIYLLYISFFVSLITDN